jgi:chemotaxis response regulator CheB
MPKNVLVVEDSNLMRHRIVQCLTNAGYNVVGKAKDGDEGITLYKELRPEAVTMDVTMRGKDGVTAAREILEYDPGAKIVMYTLLDPDTLGLEENRIAVKRVVKKGDEETLLETLAGLG